MIKVIVPLALVLVAGLVALVIVVLNRPRPTLPRADKKLLDDAAQIMARLHRQTDLDHLDVLSEKSSTATAEWLNAYNRRHPQ